MAVLLPLAAQMNRGTLTGSVTDSTGAVVPGVKIIITNTGTNARFETTSNETGTYTMPNLPPGPYKLEFASASFKKLVRSGVELGAT